MVDNKITTEGMECTDWKIRTLKRAKAEAEKGEFISHQAMGEWINSLGTRSELSAPNVDIHKKPNTL